MERWAGHVALVTGASAGIGAAITKKLVVAGMKVVGLARRSECIEELSKNLDENWGELHAFKCDLSNEDDILKAFAWTKENVGPVSVLVNNAGVIRDGFITEGKTEDWRKILDVNVIAVSICSREAVKHMREAGIDGHIINVNSIAGHRVATHPIPSSNLYPSSKHAITAFTETIRQELNYLKTKIKISSISPGLTNTEIFEAGNSLRFPPDVRQSLPILQPEDIADGIMYILDTPPHVQVHELIIKPVGEKF